MLMSKNKKIKDIEIIMMDPSEKYIISLPKLNQENLSKAGIEIDKFLKDSEAKVLMLNTDFRIVKLVKKRMIKRGKL